MVQITVKGPEVDSIAHGTRINVCTEELTAIDVLRDNLSKHMEISREEATKMVVESLAESLLIKE